MSKFFSGLCLLLFPLATMAQGLLFGSLYNPRSPAEFNVSHQQATSSWNSSYGRLATTDVGISSETFSCGEESCGYKIQAGHHLQRFSSSSGFGDTLEKPEFGALLDYRGQRRFLSELGISSPSDKPFNSIHETNISLTMAVAPIDDLKRKKESYWIYFLNYSNTRSFLPNIPLPGFTYIIPTQSGWTFSLGAPFLSATYIQYPKWSFRWTAGPYFYSSEVSYGPPVFQFGLSSSWRQDSYFVAERSRREERVYLDRKDISAFIKHPLSQKVFLEWKTSYFFHQELKYGENYASTTAPTEDLGTSVAITLSVKARLDSFANR